MKKITGPKLENQNVNSPFSNPKTKISVKIFTWLMVYKIIFYIIMEEEKNEKTKNDFFPEEQDFKDKK